MDTDHFDVITRLFNRPTERRRALIGLSLGPLAWLGATRLGENAAAKKRRERRKKTKKPKPNAFGCLNVGQPCNGDSDACCSGICEGTAPKKGKPDKSRCVAHDAAICRGPETDTCTTGVAHHCSGQNFSCGCLLTTGNGGFCGGPGSDCRVCSRDTDCQEEFGPGAACVVTGGICEGQCSETGGTICVPPCPEA